MKGVVAGPTPATCDFDVGWNYYVLRLVSTVSTTKAGAAVEPLLSDAVGQIVLNVNKDPKRTMLAYELNSIHRAWADNLSATLYSQTGNDLQTAVADTGAGPFTRTSTWVIDIFLAEPTRDSYTARKSFSWPTRWGNSAVGGFPANYTCNIQAAVGVPQASTQAGVTLSNPAMRFEAMYDAKLGPIVGAVGGTAPGVIGSDILAAIGIPAGAGTSSPVGAPIMPITQFYRWSVPYGSVAVQVRGTDWPFNKGSLQQLSLFMPTDQPDYIQGVQLLLDTAFKVKTNKASIEKMNRAWGWSELYGAGTAGNDYVAASALHLALDFSDDPSDSLTSVSYTTLELDLTLSQAASANKQIIAIAQFYRNALVL